MREILFKSKVDIDNMSYTQLRNLASGTTLERFRVIEGTKDKWYYGIYSKVLKFRGRKHFVTTTREISVSYSKGKWYGTSLLQLSQDSIKRILEYFNITWTKDLLATNRGHWFSCHKSVLKAIIDGKIQGEQDYYTFIAKRVYQVDLPWKSMRKFINECSSRVSIYDIIDFTTDPICTIDNLSRKQHIDLFDGEEREKISIIEDEIINCSKLDKKFNPHWSFSRINEEHTKSNRELQLAEIMSKDNTPIYTPKVTALVNSIDNLDLLDNEQQAFIAGVDFNNCIYRCYWGNIKRHSYAAFIYKGFTQDIMVGLHISHGRVCMQQAYYKYNNSIDSEERTSLVNLIDNNQELLKKLFIKDFEEIPW